jgi:proline iminopeptidase
MPSWKLWCRRGIAVVVLLIVVVAALCAAGVLPYFLASWSASVLILAASAAIAFILVTWGGGWLGALTWHAENRARFAAAFSGVLTILFVIVLYLAVLRPARPRLTDAIRSNNTRYWQLPTGSRIAYSEYDPPPGTAVDADPIMVLHGGPGMRIGPFDRDFYSPLAAHGFRVFLFDQAGSGLSDLLPRVRDYTMTRAVEDLEAIRKQIRTDKMILIGHSWGSTLAASNMAKYPNHVAKVVFYSPGPIWNISQELERADYSRTGGGAPDFSSLRLPAALVLLDRNPDAAENLLPQSEAEELFVPLMAPTVPSLVCQGDASKLPPAMRALATSHENPNLNPYALQQLVSSTEAAGDPHAALRGNKTPAMVLFGECDYLPWSGALDYRKTLPNAKTYYVPKAGHYIQFEEP